MELIKESFYHVVGVDELTHKEHTHPDTYLDTDQRYSGLFACVASTGAVQNLKLTNSYLSSTNREFGGIAGRASGGIFYNVYVDALMQCSGATNGGLIGQINTGDVVMANCWFGGELTNTLNSTNHQGTGGLVGLVSGGTLKMVNCLNSGTISKANFNKLLCRNGQEDHISVKLLHHAALFERNGGAKHGGYLGVVPAGVGNRAGGVGMSAAM